MTNQENPMSFSEHTHRIAAEIRELLAREEAEIRGLRAKIDEAQARRQKLQRAVDALVAEPRLKQKKPSKPKDSNDWRISNKMVENVWAVVQHITEPQSAREISELAGVSIESARRAIEKLRQVGEVRMVGIEKVGNNQPTKKYMPMPTEVPNAA